MFDFRRAPANWGALIFLSVFLFFVDSMMIGPGLVRAVRSETFQTAPGVVTKSEIGPGHKGAVDFELEYTYTVNGQPLTGKDYHVQPQLVGNGYWIAAHEAHPVGAPVTVCFDPDDPADAVLVPGLRPDSLVVVWALTPFHLILLGFVWAAWVHVTGRREFDPDRRRCVTPTANGWRVYPAPTNRPAPIALAALFIITFAGCFVAGISTLAFDSPPPWVVVIPVWALAIGGSAYFGLRCSRHESLHVRDAEGTLTFPRNGKCITVARDRVLGIDVTAEARKSSEGEYEVFVATLRWRNDFDREESAWLAEYRDRRDADALAGWLRERLGLTAV